MAGDHCRETCQPHVRERERAHILKGEDSGWDKVPRVKYITRGRYGCRSFLYDSQWPPVDTQRKSFALDAPARTDSQFAVIATSGRPKKRLGSAVTFITPPFERNTLVAGQSIVKLFLSVKGASDTDLFLGLRYISKDGHEILFDGILDSPNLLVAYGHQRLSLRKPDDKISHGDFLYTDGSVSEPVKEGEIVEVHVMLSPISVIVEKGGRLVLEVSSRNVENSYCYIMNDPNDRKTGGVVKIHTGESHPSELMLPFQPVELRGMPEGI
ncbi:uncharacterized protein Z518_02121 [Rhinocladiella mackenziei CBS 650.93]|uniref:Xaa-Pro dipeptidyl-peptidase C-terminal domain-containing protein n=1 Tax=Rhinocladiella mackenziei CBS 650.93 TaxID=1442369 RepID=A0A0D2HAH5_9EURO|nr:uncharacterized protein Z518_02121 [Rhinocladiella mackenziei CBS 650.93]KIX07468.1 hypothetical protein Z518_02121 [Rhinocladiella mackenziei CBS 650.93]